MNKKNVVIESDVPSSKRVPLHTSEKAQERILRKTIEDIAVHLSAGKDLLDRRLTELEYEWDIEKTLETNAAIFSLTGLMLTLKSKKWIILPIAISSFLLQHALMGWCPPVTFFRNIGVRTRKEIEEERNALKRIRGDFGKFETKEKDPLKVAEALLNRQAE